MDYYIASKGVEAGWFGLIGNGIAADDTAMANAVAEAATLNKPLILPGDVTIRLTTPLVLPDVNNFEMSGLGVESTVFLLDPAVSNGDGFHIASDLLHHRYQNFGVQGKHANPAGKVWSLASNVSAGGSGHIWENILLSSDSGSPGYDKGWWLDPTGGQNSEMKWVDCWTSGYVTAGWHFPGAEQYNLSLEKCAFNGGWDGMAVGTVGGKYGIKTENGAAFRAVNCFGGANNSCDFSISGFNGQPCIIENWNGEISYGLLNADQTLTTSAGVALISFRGGRVTYGASGYTFASDGVVKFSGAAGLAIEEMQILAVGTPPSNYPKIAIAPGQWPRNMRIRGNHFTSQNSVSVDPIIIVGTFSNMRAAIDIRQNDYLDNSNVLAYRNETINQAPQALSFFQDCQNQPNSCPDIWFCDLTLFNAASASQTMTFMTIPGKQLCFDDFKALLANYVVVTGGATISAKIGTTSGGDQLMAATTLGGSSVGDSGATYGTHGNGLGSAMPGWMDQSSVPAAGTPQTIIYVTLTASSGNLGNGTVSNITRGLLHLMPVYRNAARVTA